MKALRAILQGTTGWAALAAFALGLVLAQAAVSAASPAIGTGRTVLAITYPEGRSTTVDLVGSTWATGVLGKAEVKRQDGRTRVKVHLDDLVDPRTRGSAYTTYMLWAIAPEGQAEPLAELPFRKGVDLDVTTSFQTFGLLVTAEPHAAVRLPSAVVVAENVARDDTKGVLRTARIEYSGASADLTASAPVADYRDRHTPPSLLGARHAVDMARDAGADRYAAAELREAEVKLAGLEQSHPHGKKLPKHLEATAREVMRLADHARAVAEQRAQDERAAAERRAASARLDAARADADRARTEAERAHERAEREGKEAAAALSEAQRQRDMAADAAGEAERARAEERVARADAESARREAFDAKQSREDLQRQLYESLSAILETRREARGLIVNLSDVLFDFNRATLTPGAREKLSKLAGIMLAYPASYRIAAEGHTDSIGSDEYNLRLSEERARSVLSYLRGAGLPPTRIADAVGYGKSRPIASNDSAAGRQMNRRVEIVISGLES
jgi:outer membrane protein OmpA-like peptidoglycan-associated protein